MEVPGRKLTFLGALICTKQTTYMDYKICFPGNSFKTVKNTHAFIIQSNFYDRYCLQHFTWSPNLSRHLYEPLHVNRTTSRLLFHNALVSLTPPPDFNLCFTQREALTPWSSTTSQWWTFLLFQFSLKMQSHKAFYFISCFIEGQTSEKLVRSAYEHDNVPQLPAPLFLPRIFHSSSHMQSFSLAMQSSLISSLELWYHFISYRVNYQQTVHQRTFPRSFVQGSKHIIKKFWNGRKNHGMSYPEKFTLWGTFRLHCPWAICNSANCRNLIITQIILVYKNARVLSGGM